MLISLQEAAAFLNTHHAVFDELWRRRDESLVETDLLALISAITTQGETVEEVRMMVRDAINCYFDDPALAPKIIRLHFVRDEVLAR